jgi:hypothetical protein
VNIEVVEFYPITLDEAREILTGTLRVKIPAINLHVLGIFVSKKKNFWFFTMPGKKAIHHETGVPVRFPFIFFEGQQQRELMDAIRTNGKAYIEKRLADKENPLMIPKKQPLAQEAKNHVEHTVTRVDADQRDSGQPMQKKTASHVTNPAKIASIQWSDPPKRTSTFTRKPSYGKK